LAIGEQAWGRKGIFPNHLLQQVIGPMNQFDVEQIRQDFPILSTMMCGKPLVYFDNGATTQKPRTVIDTICKFYEAENANIHRGAYDLSRQATDKFEVARATVAQFLGGVNPKECIFTSGTTEGINLLAHSWGWTRLQRGDEVLVSGLEHHSNIVPWELACGATGASLKHARTNKDGSIDVADFRSKLNPRTKLVALQATSNALGTIHDLDALIQAAKEVGALVLVDGAQAVAHQPTNLLKLGCDFFVFSGHKLFGPTGIGVLWGRKSLLESLPPYKGGGDMIETVSFEGSTFADLPHRFEAGTPNISGALGLAVAIKYVQAVGLDRIQTYENHLLQYATAAVSSIKGVRIVGTAPKKVATISFVIDEPFISLLDISEGLNQEGIATRIGHHCCMPLMNELGIAGTCRASLAFYNTEYEVDLLVNALERMIEKRVAQLKNIAPSPKIDGDTLELAELFEKHSAGAGRLSIDEVADELEEEFDLVDSELEKNTILNELGQKLPKTFAHLKAHTPAVSGCMSEVYLAGRPIAAQPDRIEFVGDSNNDLVRGLIALLQQLFSGQRAEDIQAFDLESFIRRIGLDKFVTLQRRNGLAGMAKRIHAFAQEAIEQKSKT
jgi:cysteine desulfurase / selenocysteine lyase